MKILQISRNSYRRCSKKSRSLHNILRKAPLFGFLFNKVVPTHMMIMMMINFFVVWLTDERRSLISSRDHSQRSSPSRNSDTPRAGFEPPQNLSSGFAEWSWAAVITTTPRRHKIAIFVKFLKECKTLNIFWKSPYRKN